MTALGPDSRPRLAPGVRLRHDGVRDAWVLLAPETIIDANPVAVEIIRRLTGDATLAEVVDDLAGAFTAERSLIEADVRALLDKMIGKGLVEP
ncbi:pyrroloquinoline quinone biosynthesis peptide chaperone PqqD [Terrihabitans sp. PJ23]|uniref:Pyrroloquinoline quinone biosynthesis peptide chaperone PqqD n=1 Tax=Terrihabitans rhizophilus TaxID=3092662 RepID=A0ABU4RSY9_9HYPH|nr:pyrroloquinoline quinone biosynthesis peptide chaperone PqqD [Terrihabitans sp. PJ23]MDX6807258.1 pyrroloquinoline quinone biosynthesis peptide chaperone PqqD [Terrihabitans sp. PJ23]